jgi:hypothetical protein
MVPSPGAGVRIVWEMGKSEFAARVLARRALE